MQLIMARSLNQKAPPVLASMWKVMLLAFSSWELQYRLLTAPSLGNYTGFLEVVSQGFCPTIPCSLVESKHGKKFNPKGNTSHQLVEA